MKRVPQSIQQYHHRRQIQQKDISKEPGEQAHALQRKEVSYVHFAIVGPYSQPVEEHRFPTELDRVPKFTYVFSQFWKTVLRIILVK